VSPVGKTRFFPGFDHLEDRLLPAITPAGFLSPPTTYPTGPGSQSVLTADFNRDGKLDLVTGNFGDGTISLLLGNSDGSFQARRDSATGGGAMSIAISDFNDDGNSDVVSANYVGSVSVLLGNGDGSFRPRTDFPIASFAFAVQVADLNNDHRADLVIYRHPQTITWMLGRGDGTFQPATDVATDISYHALGDVNNDGWTDLVGVHGYDRSMLSVLLGRPGGTLHLAATYQAGGGPGGMAA